LLCPPFKPAKGFFIFFDPFFSLASAIIGAAIPEQVMANIKGKWPNSYFEKKPF